MSWLRTSPLRHSFSRSNRSRNIDSATDCDPRACYDSFCKHWQQAYDIILRSEPNKPSSHDDVLGVVNHLDSMVTLLLVELHNCNKIGLPGMQQTPSAPCLEYTLSENLLDKLYEWGITTGRYANAVRLEQLKLYELLVSHSRHQLLVHEPFLRPLLKILASSQNEIFSLDIEKRLVILLNQLCVVLMQNVHLLDLFFFSTSQQEHGTTNFIIFSLLIPYVHREGTLGHQARDALLLCMALSQKNTNIGTYIAKYSSMCPVLVTGLCGLYSRLPNTIEIKTIDWHRITQDDITELNELTLFMNSLEFCNAVVQVAHALIRQQLLDFMYQGFLIPVLGPAILQIFNGSHFQTNIESQISAIAYLDLIIRSVTEPGLLKIFVKFLMEKDKFDGQRIIDVLIERMESPDSRLCMVTLSLFDTLLSLHCEDIMLELLLKYLLPCQHIPISYRYKINKINPYNINNIIDYLNNLSPEVMKKSYQLKIDKIISKTIGANWNYYALNTNGCDTLYSNYHAYLFDARHKIGQCKLGCEQWPNLYCYSNDMNKKQQLVQDTGVINLIKEFLTEISTMGTTNQGLQQQNTSNINQQSSPSYDNDKYAKQLDSLQSLGESSGYESLKYRPDDEDLNFNNQNDNGMFLKKNKPWITSNQKSEKLNIVDFSEDLFTQGTASLGPFFNAIWRKLQTFTSNCLYVNLHLTGLITRLAWYPLPLINSILLRPDIPTTSDTPSFYQVLKILKQQIDAELPINEKSLEFIDIARSFLIDREFRLINIRKNILDPATATSPTTPSGSNNNNKNNVSNVQHSQTIPVNQIPISPTTSAMQSPQLTPSSSYDPFKRNDTKRKSLTQSFSNMFRRPSGSGSGSSSQNSLQLKETNSQDYQVQQPSSLDSLNSNIIDGVACGNDQRARDLALCAVILDEWLKELSAISQEQSIVMLVESFSKDAA